MQTKEEGLELLQETRWLSMSSLASLLLRGLVVAIVVVRFLLVTPPLSSLLDHHLTSVIRGEQSERKMISQFLYLSTREDMWEARVALIRQNEVAWEELQRKWILRSQQLSSGRVDRLRSINMNLGRVQWDEANIVKIESNKPFRQKITELKTPYHPMIDDDGSVSPRGRSFDECVDDMQHAAELRIVLNQPAAALSSRHTNLGSGSCGWSSSEEEDEVDPMDQDDEDGDGEKNARFNEHRRVHYDEFR